MRTDETEVGNRRLFDVPAYMYKEAFRAGVRWLSCMLRGRKDEAFWHETHLRFFQGFFVTRRADNVR